MTTSRRRPSQPRVVRCICIHPAAAHTFDDGCLHVTNDIQCMCTWWDETPQCVLCGYPKNNHPGTFRHPFMEE